ncbi:DnaD domain-containing protein [Virgibacillus sp. FSP13]
MSGWIKFHRKILDNELWYDVTTFRLFTLLLLRASHKDGLKVKGIEINRGQYLRSYSKLAEDLEFKEGRGYKKVSKSTIKRSVQKLIDDGMVTVRETDSGTVFNIVKYHEYQGLDDHQEPINRTDSGTLTERTQNEGGTNPEQEQELKNYRIKDLSSSSDTEFAEVMKFYQSNLQKGVSESPFNNELIVQWFDEWGHELLISAMKVAAKAEAKGVNMVEGILKKWKEAGVNDLDDARKYETEFRNKKKPNKNNNVISMKNREEQYDDYDYGF